MKIYTLLFSLTLALTLTACNQDSVSQSLTDPEKVVQVTTVEPSPGSEPTATLNSPATEESTTLSATYTAYDATEAEGQAHVLFFYAPWCPTCVKWEAMLDERMVDLKPEVLIYKTDYDTSDDLKKQYGITKQSTAVFVNADGSVAKTEADPSVESLNAFFES